MLAGIVTLHIAGGWALITMQTPKLIIGEIAPMEVRMVQAEQPPAPAEAQLQPPEEMRDAGESIRRRRKPRRRKSALAIAAADARPAAAGIPGRRQADAATAAAQTQTSRQAGPAPAPKPAAPAAEAAPDERRQRRRRHRQHRERCRLARSSTSSAEPELSRALAAGRRNRSGDGPRPDRRRRAVRRRSGCRSRPATGPRRSALSAVRKARSGPIRRRRGPAGMVLIPINFVCSRGSHARHIGPGLRPFSPELRHRRARAAGRAGADVGDLLVPDRHEGHQPAHPPAPQQKFLNFFWSATSLEAVQSELTCTACRSRSAISALAARAGAWREDGAPKLEEAGSSQETLTHTIEKVLDEETTAPRTA